jgi:adenylate kinase family enzyme
MAEVRGRFPAARVEHQAWVLAGPPGAGKTYARAHSLGLDETAAVVIDADDFRELLLLEAVVDGTYGTFLKPQEVADRENSGERFAPLDLSSLMHAEASYLARALRDQLIAEGVNVVLDTVLSDPDKAVELGKMLERRHYHVEVVDIEVPFAVSEASIVERWSGSYEKAVGTGEGLGGRWVPSVFTRDLFDTASGRSRSQDAAQVLAQTCKSVHRYRRFWRDSADAQAVLEVERCRISGDGSLLERSVVEIQEPPRFDQRLQADRTP